MALTNLTIPYVAFNKTSFGFGADEIANTTSTNTLTNAKVVIKANSGSNHWEDTGHITTVGATGCIPSYNKKSKTWTVEGPVAAVDAVLDDLEFFPSDYEDVRLWTATQYKDNDVAGYYINEDPEDTVAIPDSLFTLTVYDPDNANAYVDSWQITLDPDQPTFGKQRPYWSTLPSNEDLGTTHGSSTGDTIDFGIIAQGTDTDALTITCQFVAFNSVTPGVPTSGVPFNGTGRGSFTGGDDVYIGDKKPGTTNTTDKRINFTGSKAEVQNYLDNIRYKNEGNEIAFDMKLTIYNGVVGSVFVKHVWFSDARIVLPTLPAQSLLTDFTEDLPSMWDFGVWSPVNVQPDADSFTAKLTIDAAGRAGTEYFTTQTVGVTSGYVPSTGILTITSPSESLLRTALRNLVFGPEKDFDAGSLNRFYMDIDFTHTGSVNNSAYTSVTQTLLVNATPTVELSQPGTIHTYVEDTKYNFSIGGVPQIIHPHNDSFAIVFTFSFATGWLGIASGTGATLAPGGVGYTLSGTRNQVNAALLTLYYTPSPDYNADLTIAFELDRTSANQEHDPLETGYLQLSSTNVADFTSSPPAAIDWTENVSESYDSGLVITDISTDSSDLPAHGSTFSVACEMWTGITEFTDGSLVTNSTDSSLVTSGLGHGSSDAYIITGTKDQINIALADMKFIPNPNYFGDGPGVWYNTTRTYLGGSLGTYILGNATVFNNTTATSHYATTQLTNVDWIENVSKPFDSGFTITDTVVDNIDYPSWYDKNYKIECAMYVGSSSVEFTDGRLVTNSTDATLVTSGLGQGDTDAFVMIGKKAVLDAALADMKFIPDVDYVSPTSTIRVLYKLSSVVDPSVLLHNQGTDTYTEFNTNIATSNYTALSVPTGMTWPEDEPLDFDSSILITDTGTDNSDYGALFGTKFTVTARAKWWDGTNAQALTTAVWSSTNFGLASVSGTGIITDPLIINGTKAEINSALANLRMMPELDWTDSPEVGGGFWFEYKIDRDQTPSITAGAFVVGTEYTIKSTGTTDFTLIGSVDSNYHTVFTATGVGTGTGTAVEYTGVNYLHYNADSSSFVGGDTIAPYFSSVTGMTYLEDTDFTPFAGISVGVTETASAYTAGITYAIEVEIPVTAGVWTGTTSHIKTLSPNTVSSVNASLQALSITPTLDYSSPFDVIYTQTRYVASTGTTTPQAVGVTMGTVTGTATPHLDYYSSVAGMTYLEDTDFTPFAGKDVGVRDVAGVNYPSVVTYGVEVEISPSTSGKWTGTTSHIKTLTVDTLTNVNTALQALSITPTLDLISGITIKYSQTRYINGVAESTPTVSGHPLGTVTGTVSPLGDYYTSVSGMTYLEDTPKTIFTGKDVGITDIAPDNYADITYEVELEISPNTAGTWGLTGNSTTTLTGTKTDINVAILALSLRPTRDSVVPISILYSQDRYINTVLDTTHVYSDINIATVTGTASTLGNHFTTVVDGMTYIEDTPKTIFAGKDIGITDIAQDNYADITYEVTLTMSDSLAGTWAGTTSHIKVLTGTKTSINAEIQSLLYTPTRDYISTFDVLYSQKRFVGATPVLDATHATNYIAGTTTGTASSEYTPGLGYYPWYHEDEPKTIFSGRNIGVTDIAAYYYPNITYEVTLSLSTDGVTPSAAPGEWEVDSGIHIKTFTGTSASVNTEINNMVFAPTRDYNLDFYVLYSQKRFAGTTPVLDATHATNHNLGMIQRTGSTASEYWTAVSGNFTEDTPSQYILAGKNIGIRDVAGDPGNYIDITYEVTVEISDSLAGEWTGTGSHIKTITGTKTSINGILQNLTFTPSPDYASNFNIIYSQERFVGATPVADGTHATNVTLGQWTAQPITEYTYATSNGNIQYMVEDGQLSSTPGQVLSPKNLTENWNARNGTGYKVYTRPLTITDLYEDGSGTSQYKLVFTGMPAGTTLYDNTDTAFVDTLDWGTKTDIHTKISEGIRVSGATGDFVLSFALHRKTFDTTEKLIDTGTLSYLWLPNLIFGNSTISVNALGASNNYQFNQGKVLTSGDTLYAVNELSDFVIDFGKFTNFSNTYSYPTGITSLGEMVYIGPYVGYTNFVYPDITVPSTWTIEKYVSGDIGRIVIKLDGLSSSTVTTTDIVVVTEWGSLNRISVRLNQTYSPNPYSPYYELGQADSIPDTNFSSANNYMYQTMGYDASTGYKSFLFPQYHSWMSADNNVKVLKQSNYWDGTKLGVNFSKFTTTGASSSAYTIHGRPYTGGGGGHRSEGVFEESSETATASSGIIPTHKSIFGPWDGWDRCINSGPQGLFYGFRVVVGKRSYEYAPPLWSSNTYAYNDFGSDKDIIIDMVIGNTGDITGSSTDTRIGWDDSTGFMIHNETFTGQTPGSMQYARHTIKSSYWSRPSKMGIGPTTTQNDGSEVWWQQPYGNNSGSQYQYINDMYSPEVYVQEVKYDSANENIYVLCILEQEDNAKYAIIAKLNWSGTAYTWSTVKTIQIGLSTEYYGIEAYLSDNFETLVTIQHQYSDSARFLSTSNSRIKIYDKDQGGTDNWGEAASQTWSMASGVTNDYGTLKISGRRHDVNYCAYNGVDTIITQGGHHVFQKNQGGTNNWGENTSTGIVNVGEGIYKYTADYLICVGDNYNGTSSIVRHKFFLFDHSLNLISSPSALQDSFHGGDNASELELIEASRSHNIVGVLYKSMTSTTIYKTKTKMYTLTT